MELTDGETVLLDLRPHGKLLALPVLALLVVVAATGFGVARVSEPLGDLAIGVVGLLLLLRLSLVPFLRWRATRFLLTDERIALRSGVLRRTGRDVPLSRVDEVTYSQTLLQRLQGCGTLTVAAGDAAPVVVSDLRDVEGVQRQVYRQLDALR